MMKVLQVITSLETGGAETLVCNMIPHLISGGFDVDLCLFNGVATPLLNQIKGRNDVKVHILGHSYYNIIYLWYLIRIMKSYDIVHTHNSSPQLYVAIANLICRKKIITTEHSTNNRKRNSLILRIIDKWMYMQYNKTICISQIALDSLQNHLGHSRRYKDKLCVINNGVDVERIYHSQPINRQSINSDINCFIVTMVAGFREAKDQDTLIRAFAQLPKGGFELWLVGDGVRKQELEELVCKLGLTDIVKFLGIRMDVPAILKASDVVVMSSHWEGMSLSNIEGMSAGKPFVASNVDGLRQVTEGYGILFPHQNDSELAEILSKLRSDKEFYKQVAESCYLRAKQFDINIMVGKYSDLYMSI